jgi:exopolysaccharide production protein ExoY
MMSEVDHLKMTQFESRWAIKHIPAKRILDILFSLFALTLTLPLLICIVVAIRLTSSGHVIYSQERIGRGGKPFRCYKFRTMYADADNRLKTLLESSPALRAEWESNFKLKNDPRVTPIGAFMRRTSLDELPQFWNVLKGDLSVVGPRPVVRAEIMQHFGNKATKIFSIRPGLTGLWQISGRSDLSYATRLQLDEHYVDHQSILLDLTIIAKTIPAMLLSRGAY